MEHRGRLGIVMRGGSTHSAVPPSDHKGTGEFHLLWRGPSDWADRRRGVADEIDRRPGCRAALTMKRVLENYLAPEAVEEALGLRVEFGDGGALRRRLGLPQR